MVICEENRLSEQPNSCCLIHTLIFHGALCILEAVTWQMMSGEELCEDITNIARLFQSVAYPFRNRLVKSS